YAAATAGTPDAGARLVEIWRSLSVGGVYDWRLPNVFSQPLRLIGLGGTPAAAEGEIERLSGLLDTRPLERLVYQSIPWTELRRRLDAREIEAVAVAATEIASGKSVVWVDRPHAPLVGWAHDPFVIAREMRLSPIHALASAAIPFLFPALRVDGRYYCDGGLRLNTPLSPAI